MNATEYRLAPRPWFVEGGALLADPRHVRLRLLAGLVRLHVAPDDGAEERVERSIRLASLEAGRALRARAVALRGVFRLLSQDAESAVIDLRQVSAASTRFRDPTLLRGWATTPRRAS